MAHEPTSASPTFLSDLHRQLAAPAREQALSDDGDGNEADLAWDPSVSIWSAALPAATIGPEEWRPTRTLKPYVARFVRLPSFREGPRGELLWRLIREAGIRDALLVLPDGQVVDGVHRLEAARALNISDVPVRVLTLPMPLSESDRLCLETTITVLAVGGADSLANRTSGDSCRDQRGGVAARTGQSADREPSSRPHARLGSPGADPP
jgi:ParB/Sulfiredoxin domain